MRIQIYRRVGLLVLALSLPLSGQQTDAVIKRSEAEALVRMIPDVVTARNQGIKPQIYLDQEVKLAWVFVVVDRGRSHKEWNVVGQFAVNKYSAEVMRYIPSEILTSGPFVPLQSELRSRYHITEAKVIKWRCIGYCEWPSSSN